MKRSGLYLSMALLIVMSLAVISGCSAVTAPVVMPAITAVPTPQGTITAPVVTPVSGSPDLVVTRVWLEGSMVKYTVKNIGTTDSPQTYSYIYVNDLMPAQGNSSFVNSLKPGQEELLAFTNYQWQFGSNSGDSPVMVKVDPKGYVELPVNNNKITVSADARGDAGEAVETNNSKVTLIGVPWDYDFLSVYNMASWRNGDGDLIAEGSENEVNGAHFKVRDGSTDIMTQVMTIPQQVPNGWMQGTWGYFYSDEYGSPRTAAIKVPAKLHFIASVGLARNATGTDGVTFKLGLKDLNDTVTWISSKKISTPGAAEDWDVNLGQYEGQKYSFVLRVEAGASPSNDFAIWKQARLIQVND